MKAECEKMDQNDPEQHNLSESLNKLCMQMNLTDVDKAIEPYSGDPTQIKEWFKSIEKYCTIISGQISSKECVRLAYHTSQKTVSDFIGRILKDRTIDWTELKNKLQDHFGENIDSQVELIKLRKLKQKSNQSLKVFAEILLGKAMEIYGDVNDPFIQQELVSIFVKGLRQRSISRKILSKNSTTLKEAVKVASNSVQQEVRLHAFGLESSDEEALKVSQVTHQKNENGKKPMCTGKKLVNRWKNGKPICNGCEQIGHLYRNCLSHRSQLN